ncbi:MAG: cobalamin biosynthesis protein [Chlorobium sp.]|nr:adenosylcobinamide-phosphate synthase CbiB [Chlorobium phaeovibrioides]NQU46636.1 cobalamin biosynthesis protein [Chlorobium sp.]
MIEGALLVLGAFLLDLLLGDPRWFPHPVRGMGWLAVKLESIFRSTPLPLKISGIAVAAFLVGISGAVAWILIAAASAFHPYLGSLVSVLILWSCFATRDLERHARAVLNPLVEGDLEEARRKVSWMVGRDTDELDMEGVVLAAAESVAENTVDGVTAPIFYALLFGPVGAVAFKAASTLDSSFGYKNERYGEFGWASARLDDLLNYLPARLTVLAIALGAVAGKMRVFDIFKAVHKGAGLHESPNAGYPEAAFAGALGVRFGGARSYGGARKQAPVLGVGEKSCSPDTLRQATWLMQRTAWFFIGGGLALSAAVGSLIVM